MNLLDFLNKTYSDDSTAIVVCESIEEAEELDRQIRRARVGDLLSQCTCGVTAESILNHNLFDVVQSHSINIVSHGGIICTDTRELAEAILDYAADLLTSYDFETHVTPLYMYSNGEIILLDTREEVYLPYVEVPEQIAEINEITLEGLMYGLEGVKGIVMIGGYAGSGKTTLIKELRDLGYKSFSTSEICHNLYSLAHGGNAPETKSEEGRKQIISFIEDGIIKTFGRHGLMRVLINQILETSVVTKKRGYFQMEEAIFFECIGGEEEEIFMSLLEEYFYSGEDTLIASINVRSSFEKPGVDIRQLLKSGNVFEYRWEDQ